MSRLHKTSTIVVNWIPQLAICDMKFKGLLNYIQKSENLLQGDTKVQLYLDYTERIFSRFVKHYSSHDLSRRTLDFYLLTLSCSGKE
jgi:hypothetical protein